MTEINKYKYSKIYTIRHKNDDSLIYVGSTVQALYQRWVMHIAACLNLKYQTPLYKKMREYDINDWYIELYEDIECEKKEQLLKREGEVIRQIGTLNKVIAGGSDKKTRKEIYEKYKDKSKETQKKYYEKNKEKYQEYQKKYQEANKEKLQAWYKEKRSIHMTCVCGCVYTVQHKIRHMKSQKHINIMKELTKTLEQTNI
jgi:hypothetical protein